MGDTAGQALPLVVIVVLAVVALAAGSVRLGRDATDRATARAAADAAALAGAATGRSAAADLARANGAALVAYRRAGAEVEVRVRVGSATATARARRLGPAELHARKARGSLP